MLSLFSVQRELEIRFNDDLDRKETFFLTIRKIFEGLKNGIFPKGLTHAFGQKMPNFSFFRFVEIRLEIMLNNFVEKKETFLDY